MMFVKNPSGHEPLLLRNAKNSKHQGDIGLAIAIAWLAKNGYQVAIPLTDSNDYDLIIDIGGKLASVQVRTTYFRKKDTGNFQVTLKVTGGNRSGKGKTKYFTESGVDFLFVVTDNHDMYFIPRVEVDTKVSLTLCDKYEQYRVY
jgi:hypothetical protein